MSQFFAIFTTLLISITVGLIWTKLLTKKDEGDTGV